MVAQIEMATQKQPASEISFESPKLIFLNNVCAQKEKRAANVDLPAEQEGGTGRGWPKFLKNFKSSCQNFSRHEERKNPDTSA